MNATATGTTESAEYEPNVRLIQLGSNAIRPDLAGRTVMG
jgi:hypothetical protein